MSYIIYDKILCVTEKGQIQFAITLYVLITRYPDDVFDRIWSPHNFHLWETLNTSLTVDFQANNHYQVPSVVMQTAATPINGSNPLNFYLDQVDASEYYFYMHFAEVVKLEANQYRSFNITLNGEHWYGPLVPHYLYTTTVHSVSASTGGKYYFSIIKTENSTLPPIMNAYEVYSVKNLSQSETDQQDGMLLQTCLNYHSGALYILVYIVFFFFIEFFFFF